MNAETIRILWVSGSLGFGGFVTSHLSAQSSRGTADATNPDVKSGLISIRPDEELWSGNL